MNGLKNRAPIAGGFIPGGIFPYENGLGEYYIVTYYNPKPGVILYNYTKYTNVWDYLAAFTLILEMLGVPSGAPVPAF